MGDGRGGPGASGECRRSGDGAKDNGVEPGVGAGISPHLPPDGGCWPGDLPRLHPGGVGDDAFHFRMGGNYTRN